MLSFNSKMNHWQFTLFIVSILIVNSNVLLTGCATAGATVPTPQMRIKTDIRYDTAARSASGFNQLDVFYAEKTSATAALNPVIVFIHGGNWTGGDKANLRNQNNAEIPQYFVQRGYVFVALNFRLASEDQSIGLADMATDIAHGLRWIHQHIKEYGGKNTEMVLWGYSSGAHLATLIAMDKRYLSRVNLTPQMIAGVIGMDVPQYDVPKAFQLLATEDVGGWNETTRARQLETLFGRTATQQREFSPSEYLTEQTQRLKFLLISSGRMHDGPQTFSNRMSNHFKNKLTAKGVTIQHRHFEEFSHAELMSQFLYSDLNKVVMQYLRRLHGQLSSLNDTVLPNQLNKPTTQQRAAYRGISSSINRNHIAYRLGQLDHNGDGIIEWRDIPTLAGQQAFLLVDRNGDHRITIKEMDQFLAP
ncbi:alpha/beta hydrolase [Rhodoferax sp. 4810]|uniref:Alpha/beta hydrolase n=1 Tax=Thiospirillum jenense TaxID=1653858 RepID=A0A839HFC2_9GAMM|nr:alpha/beta hydrolase [Thiospirillum jenense]MBB1073357.1 alpha/beta hydrolase [Rhodoferax jenense]MBB1125709.1 alpha/beta hydrolase [Thiospirillum jenense]